MSTFQTPNKLKVGIVQQSIQGNDKHKNWEESAKQVRKLAAQGCQCILLQELHSSLYFCQTEDVNQFD